MYTLPPKELLETTHTFPTVFMFKVIGKSERGFLARAVAAVREAMNMVEDPPYRSRDAVGGRHISVTFQPLMDSADQILAVYERLKKLDGLVMLL